MELILPTGLGGSGQAGIGLVPNLPGLGAPVSVEAPYSPADEAEVVHYWRSDSGVLKSGGGAAANNDVAVQWTALKGGVSLAHATKGPTLKTNRLNGYPALYFAGASAIKYLHATSGLALAQPFTVIVIGKADGNAGGGMGTDYFYDDYDGASRVALLTALNTKLSAYAGGSDVIGSSDYIGSGYRIFTTKYNGASSGTRIDGSVEASGDAGANALASLTLGARFGTPPSNGLEGDILELIIGALSDATRDRIEAYAATRYAL